MCAKANLSTAFLPDFVNKLQLKLQCGLIVINANQGLKINIDYH